MSGGLLAGIVAVGAVAWGFMGIYIVDEAERGVVLRFGEVLNATVQPGLAWNPPIVDEVSLVNVSELYKFFKFTNGQGHTRFTH